MKYKLILITSLLFACNNNTNHSIIKSENNVTSKKINASDLNSNSSPNINSSNDECTIINLVINKVKEEDKIDSPLLERKYVKWDEAMYFDFNINGLNYLPKSVEERNERLKSKSIADPYPIFYLFASPDLDNIFTLEDRKFMRSHIKNNIDYFECDNFNIPIADRRERVKHRLAVTQPLFNKDNTKAAIVVHWDHSYYQNQLTSGLVQNFYLQKGKNGWKIIHATEIWLL